MVLPPIAPLLAVPTVVAAAAVSAALVVAARPSDNAAVARALMPITAPPSAVAMEIPIPAHIPASSSSLGILSMKSASVLAMGMRASPTVSLALSIFWLNSRMLSFISPLLSAALPAISADCTMMAL